MKYFVSFVWYEGENPFPKFSNVVLDTEAPSDMKAIEDVIKFGSTYRLNQLIASDRNIHIIAFNDIKEPE